MKIMTKLWLGVAVMVILSPIGLILPEHFKAGAAWGEWGMEEIQKLAGYIPQGFKKLATIWDAPIPDYAFKGWEGRGLTHMSCAYMVSAVVGVGVTVLLVVLIGKVLAKKGD